jgi:conjugal transfer pilus assembly protein TraV
MNVVSSHPRRRPVLALLVVAPLAGACSTAIPGASTFSCQGELPNGICASARDVYRQTDDRNRGQPRADATPAEGGGTVVSAATLASASAASTAAPVRSAPPVLRVWVAPHETVAGDFHAASVVFTELAPRRWAGGGAFGGAGPAVLRPLDPSAPFPAPPPAASGGAAPRGGGGPALPDSLPSFEPRREMQAAGPRRDELDDGETGGFFGPRPPVQAASATSRGASPPGRP